MALSRATLRFSGCLRSSSRVPRVASIVQRQASALAFVEQARGVGFGGSRAPPFVPPPPQDSGVGILACEAYVPNRFVSQAALEEADGVGAGKYTIGLGQERLAFVDDREDINSICMNAVQNLLTKYGIQAHQVGRLEVGTESLVDKSKSAKTVIAGHLFGDDRNLEGATSINACYGGTAALLNSVAWVESSDWTGKYAIYVTADIAVYEKGPARPTGGCGAVAMLIGPGAPLKLVPGSRFSHTADVYDFYKASMMSEYPQVDGRLSQACYLRAVDDCYNGACRRLEQQRAAGGDATTDPIAADHGFDLWLFHSPYQKLVRQSFGRLLFNDAMARIHRGLPLPAHLEPLRPYASMPYEQTLLDRDLMKTLAVVSEDGYERQVAPSTRLSANIGNSYAAAVHANILSLVSSQRSALEGKRIGAFSYGSGAIATLFALEGSRPGPGPSAEFTLDRIADTVDLDARLAARREATVDEYVGAMEMREASYGEADVVPVGSIDNIEEGAWYLDSVDSKFVRHYKRKGE